MMGLIYQPKQVCVCVFLCVCVGVCNLCQDTEPLRKEPEHDLDAVASAERISSGLAKDNDMIDIGQVSRGMHATH